VTDDGHGDERDPLLVRPFVLHDSGALGDDESAQTWPSAAVRDVRSRDAPDNADAPTAVLHLPFRRQHAAAASTIRPAAKGTRGRRLTVLVGVATVVVLSAAAAGYAALRDDVRPSVSTGLPGGPVPAATGPATTGAAGSPPSGTSTTPFGRSGSDAPGSTTKTGAPAGPIAQATSKPTGSPSAGVPIALDPSPNGGGKTTTPRSPEGSTPATPAGDRVGVIRGQNSLCLDLNGGVPFDGNHIQVFGCNETNAQTWTLAVDGTLRVLGKCALAAWDDSVRIVRCDGRTTAQWRLDNQRLINAASNDCLTDPSEGRRPGTGVRVSDCDGSASQRWSLQ